MCQVCSIQKSAINYVYGSRELRGGLRGIGRGLGGGIGRGLGEIGRGGLGRGWGRLGGELGGIGSGVGGEKRRQKENEYLHCSGHQHPEHVLLDILPGCCHRNSPQVCSQYRCRQRHRVGRALHSGQRKHCQKQWLLWKVILS